MVDANPPWNVRERALVKAVESYMTKSEKNPGGNQRAGVREEAISIMASAESARDEWRCTPFPKLAFPS